MLAKAARQCFALSSGQVAGGVGLIRIVGPSLGQTDPSAVEKGVNALQPRPPVQVGAVVGVPVEGNELPAGLVAQPQQELVEDLAPCPGMEHGAVGEHPFEVEETCPDRVGQAEHLRVQGHRREPRHRLDSAQPRQADEHLRGLAALMHEVVSPLYELRSGERAILRRSGRARPSPGPVATVRRSCPALVAVVVLGRPQVPPPFGWRFASRGEAAGLPLLVARCGMTDWTLIVPLPSGAGFRFGPRLPRAQPRPPRAP